MRFIVGVGQHAHIKHIIGMNRNTTLEGEGLEDQGQLGLRGKDQRLDVAFKLRRLQKTGVNDVCLVSELRQQLSFFFDRFVQISFNIALRVTGFGQGVASSGFRETLNEGLCLGV